jgi:hypothetical protein
MAAQPPCSALVILLLEPKVEFFKALDTWYRDEEVTAGIPHQAFDFALVVTFGRTSKALLKEIMGLQLREDLSSFAGAVAQDAS